MAVVSRIVLCACLLALVRPAFAAKHETWFEARSPNFVVVSNAGEKQARKTAGKFEQIRAVFREYLMVAKDRPSPVVTILAVKDEGSLRELLPEYWAKGHTRPAGIFFYNLGQYEAAVQLDAEGTNPYEVIYHEYYHSLTLPYFPNLPLWVAEGFAEFFGHTEVTDKVVHSGRASPEQLYELTQTKLIPLDVLFKVDHTSPYYNEQNKTSIFYAESWALTHYLMVADNGSHKDMIVAYLRAVDQGARPEEAAAKGFGDLHKLQRVLEDYVRRESFFELRGPAPPSVPETDMRSRELSDAEVDAYRGGFEALRGHPQDGKPILEEAMRLDPKLALARQNLGLADFFGGQQSEALASFSAAVAIDPKNALTRYLRAYLSLRGSMMGRDPQIEEDLRQAIAADPNFAPPYGLLSVYLAGAGENLPEALSLAKKGVSLEPGRSGYALSVAQVLARMRRFDEAQAAAQGALANAVEPSERANAEQFLSYLQQARDFSAGRVSDEIARAATASRSDDTNDLSDEPTKDDASSGAGDGQRATGIVTQVSCVAAGPRIDLQTPSETLHLHSASTGGLMIRTMFRPPPGFNPCTSLKGMRALVQYIPDEGKAQSGTMSLLQILSPGDQGGTEKPATDGTQTSNPPGGVSDQQDELGSKTTVKGQIVGVTCDNNEMLVKMLTTNRPLTLHAKDYTLLGWIDDRGTRANTPFLPCTQLKGRLVSVTFTLAEHKRYDGEIEGIEIQK
jgi:tetratricopeptide (TPR) repeat protein